MGERKKRSEAEKDINRDIYFSEFERTKKFRWRYKRGVYENKFRKHDQMMRMSLWYPSKIIT